MTSAARALAGAGLGLALMAGCPGGSSSHKAVPTDVEIEWPDAAVFPDAQSPEDSSEPDSDSDPDSGSESDAGSESSPPMAPSMSTGSSG